MKRASLGCLLLLSAVSLSAATFPTNAPSTTNNDDTCDVALLPAATLLLPFFEVDLTTAGSETTIFTVTNTSNLPQALAVTLWTDFAYPVMSFPIYLTGYDVQSINLYDVIVRGRLAPDRGTGSDVSPVGALSGTSPNDDFDNPQVNESTCEQIPVTLPNVYITRMQSAFTLGRVAGLGTADGCNSVGNAHTHATGYATVDVMRACTTSLPVDSTYFAAEIGYDNVLMGDYLQVDGTNNFAQGNPMVHIRAIPEGAANRTTNLGRTFYSRYQPAATRTRDGRQPLPAIFAARWIAGGGAGFETFFKIWREGVTGTGAACADYVKNGRLPIAEIVRFDEEENPETFAPEPAIDPPMPFVPVLPATSLLDVRDSSVLPDNSSGDVGGWMYFNLHDSDVTGAATQNWMVVSMRSDKRFSVDSDAISLGNGCTPITPKSNAYVSKAPPIGPAPNTNP